MEIFQKSVLQKYLTNLNKEQVKQAFAKFKSFYGNQARIENIRLLKEENYQEGFLREIFVQVLGYTINPNENYNLTTEFKNQTDARKADGAILKNGDAVGVIELKSTKTRNLESIKEQAFSYKNNQSNCRYVITSNFQKLRFYIDNATEYEEFDLFSLSGEQFEIFYLILNKDSILNDLPLKLKEETKFHEEKISDKFYRNYSEFKANIYNNLIVNNPQHDKLILFKMSQKLLDRLLFTFFAEDTGLVPPNAISRIVEQWRQLKDLEAYQPLYDRFKLFFTHLNEGKKYKNYELPPYNGGLFAPDDILDNLNIDDEVLNKDSLKLSSFDFNTDVDVNILGHIFEHSISEIEEITAEIQGEQTDRKKSRRKKEGIFYTPKYITQYIVENTVGALCKETKQQLKIDNIDTAENYRTVGGKLSAKGKELFTKLEDYKKWLLTLKILDPACGSGAFLNQALDFLIKEHQTIDDMIAELLNEPLRLFDTDKAILENNLFGVDINEESVEIAKLSLWLRTAKKGRQLSDLNNNIKCGNSLIDDPDVAGDKAFDWNVEFADIMQNGGFDVVFGNPPYVDIKGLDTEIVKALFNKYSTTENRINLYSIFIEKSYSVLKNRGFFSFINPNSILVNSSYTKIRNLLIDDITTIIKLPDVVFPDAEVETIIFEFRKGGNLEFANTLVYPKDVKINFIEKEKLKKKDKKFWKQSKTMIYNIYVSDADVSLLQKCEQDSIFLAEIADFTLGITPYDKYKGHSPEIIKNRMFHSENKLDDFYKPLISGANIVRYYVNPLIKEYIKYGDWLGAMREERFFTEPRIIVRQIVSGKPPRIYAGYADQSYYFTQIGFGIIPKSEILVKYLLALLNSTLLTYYHKYKFLDLEKELFQKILIANCKQFPIKVLPQNKQKTYVYLADCIIELNNQLQQKKNKFLKRINVNLEIEKITNKLEFFYNHDFKTFLTELKKQKIKLSLKQQDEWEDYFNEYKTEINNLQNQISQTDREIDQMVYKLYGLTPEEIEIVENEV